MPFCTKCGNRIGNDDKFCFQCGAPILVSQSESNELTNQLQDKIEPIRESKMDDTAVSHGVTSSEHSEGYSIDRKTLFEDGMLVLTSTDLILYSSDEKDELKRIPLTIIDECSYSMLSRGLVIKKRVNAKENFDAHLNALRQEKSELEEEIEELKQEMKESDKEEREQLKEKLSKLESELGEIDMEVKELVSNPTKIEIKEREVADIQKEVFRLSKNYSGKHSSRDEYKIWEYAVKRRIEGLSKLKVETSPHGAIVRINNEVVGTTPLTIELPLLDDAVLKGEYNVELLKEEYERVTFSIPTDHNKAFKKSIELKTMKTPDRARDEFIKSLRPNLPDRSVDLAYYLIEREIMGTNELLLLTKDTLLVMNKDKTQYLFEIPYGSIKEVKYDRGLFGNKSIRIIYNEKDFKDELFELWIDNKNGQVTAAEVKRYSESLIEYLTRKMKESTLTSAPMHKRAKEHYIITERDLQDNFRRFEPYEFEELIAKLFAAKGYQVEVTPKSGDYGVDVIARAGHDVLAIQVKHWEAAVGGPDVHKTLGSMITYSANRAMVITTSDFTNQAYEIQKRGAPVVLWNGERVKEEFRRQFLNN